MALRTVSGTKPTVLNILATISEKVGNLSFDKSSKIPDMRPVEEASDSRRISSAYASRQINLSIS